MIMAPYRFYTSVTRNSDLWETPYEVVTLPRSDWSTGDFVVGRVTGERSRLYQCETKTGRMAEMVRGDQLVGALGRRAATLEGVGDWREVGPDLALDALTSAGLLGKATSTSPLLPDLMRLEYLGHVHRDGRKLGMGDFVRPVAERVLEIPVVVVIGTSMSAGKTSSGRVVIRALNYLGYRVAAAKLTGAARYRDILSYRDSGAIAVFDFVDVGLPSTACPEALYRPALGQLLSAIAGAGADAVVVEAGASPLEPYNGAAAVEALRDLTRFTILCASDPYAVLGVQIAFGDAPSPDVVAGPAANTEAAIALVRQLTGLPALNLLDRANYPELTRMLAAVLGHDERALAAPADAAEGR
jgi:hypothetical protein